MTGAEVLCVGEVLWDSLPAGLFLGGAPLNVARHLRAQGVPARIVSRVGADRLGEEALERVDREGVATDLVQVDPELPTGFVKVRLDGRGIADYEIVRPAAWDTLEATAALLDHAGRADTLVFGTLAQRSATTRATLERLWETGARKIYDVNLRPPYAQPETVRRSLAAADVVKMNENELARLGEWFGASGDTRARAAALAHTFRCEIVCITRGEDGATLWRDGEWSEHPGFSVAVRDTVGAGDAFLATLIAGLRRGDPDAELLRRANRVGAWVASREGAVPAGNRGGGGLTRAPAGPTHPGDAIQNLPGQRASANARSSGVKPSPSCR
ncbi:MAG: carbohydrate kinase [Gemmatimonadetes bacterium]|nr:carbohydrate kinase [Gemmatimonadota bacterium]